MLPKAPVLDKIPPSLPIIPKFIIVVPRELVTASIFWLRVDDSSVKVAKALETLEAELARLKTP